MPLMDNETTDAVQLLMDDHEKLQDLFDDFEDTHDAAARKQIFETVRNELTAHTHIEEEIFYPAVRAELGDDDLVDEAEEEHHMAKMLLNELADMSADDERYAAKFTVLAEGVWHHIREEEGEMFPKAKASDLDLEELGERMAARKQELMKEMGGAPYMGGKNDTETVARRDR